MEDLACEPPLLTMRKHAARVTRRSEYMMPSHVQSAVTSKKSTLPEKLRAMFEAGTTMRPGNSATKSPTVANTQKASWA